jgi:hypothetical protein
MQARYAYHLTRIFKHLRDADADLTTKYLYTFVYPQIYTAVKRGVTNVDLHLTPSETIIMRLAREGYVVSTKNGRTNLDWQPMPETPTLIT